MNISSEDADEHFREWECRKGSQLGNGERINLSKSKGIRMQCEIAHIQWVQFSKSKNQYVFILWVSWVIFIFIFKFSLLSIFPQINIVIWLGEKTQQMAWKWQIRDLTGGIC